MLRWHEYNHVVVVQGPGRSELSRDFTYVDDIVDGVLAALGEIKPSGKQSAEYKVRCLLSLCTCHRQHAHVMKCVRRVSHILFTLGGHK